MNTYLTSRSQSEAASSYKFPYKIKEFDTASEFNAWSESASLNDFEIIEVNSGVSASNGIISVLYKECMYPNMYDGFSQGFIDNVMNPLLDQYEEYMKIREAERKYREIYGNELVDLAKASNQPISIFCNKMIHRFPELDMEAEKEWSAGF